MSKEPSNYYGAVYWFMSCYILNGSRTVLLAIVSDNNPMTQNILDCCHDLKNLVSIGENILLQWVPAYCGVPGNEKADFLANK
ncbi:hypothetical protein TNIN_247361 [Trichonephila inaurata madagascariensis]|uniref:RNase H type-1 domain-containing protein n=1 Tax=Trichonephila inaurata madagascariensis TaxID=2747483 RepID=A0A8X6X086_9ARAC|nr:hypothetical protein TNIN_247361 [Trichonephila inaurata madagascariensis]